MTSANQKFLETAESLGASLTRQAIWSGNRCNWFGWPVMELRAGAPSISYRMCGPDYCEGTTGIAYFLSHLHAMTGERIFRVTGEGAVRQAMSRMDEIPATQLLSFRKGLIGIAQSLLTLAKTCEIEKFQTMALFILEEICQEEFVLKTVQVDSLAVSGLLKIHRDHPKDFLLQTAVSLGHQLLSEYEGGSRHGDDEYLTDAFLCLFEETAKEKFKHAAESAYQVRSTRETANKHQPGDQAQWAGRNARACRTGLHAWRVLRDDFYLDQARVDLQQLCHSLDRSMAGGEVDFSFALGRSGQADVLIDASRLLQDTDYRAAGEKLAVFGIDNYGEGSLPWPCYSPGKMETPGLMTGLAGIGYLYLRLCDDLKNPSLDLMYERKTHL